MLHLAVFHNILWSKYKGVVFSAVYRLAPEHGFTVSFCQIAETDRDRAALGGVDRNYHNYPFELLFNGSYYSISLSTRVRRLAAQAWKTEADIVIIPGYERPEYWAMLAVLILRRKTRAVFCDSTAFDRPRRGVKELAKRLFFRCCDGFFGYGVRSKEYLMSYGVPEGRIFHGCQAAALSLDYTEAKALAHRLESAPRDSYAPHYLYVGRLSQEKDLPTLLKALRIVSALRPNAMLTLVGAGPMKVELVRLAEELGIGQLVMFPGSMGVDQLAAQYAQATALVLPSISEPWGLVVNEALSMGCPVVVSRICGCVPELVVHGRTGFVFSPGDVDDLAARLLDVADTMGPVESVAEQCLIHMRRFSPTDAASQILTGSNAILKMNERSEI